MMDLVVDGMAGRRGTTGGRVAGLVGGFSQV